VDDTRVAREQDYSTLPRGYDKPCYDIFCPKSGEETPAALDSLVRRLRNIQNLEEADRRETEKLEDAERRAEATANEARKRRPSHFYGEAPSEPSEDGDRPIQDVNVIRYATD
jgi:hypothetical protein